MSVSSLDVEAISSTVIAFDQFYWCSSFVLSQANNLLVQCRNVTILSLLIIDLVWLGQWCLTPLSTSYIIAVSFIGG